jgi:ribonuclease HI
MNDPIKLYFDGSAAPNPGPITTCVWAGGKDYIRADYAAGDNNEAEWQSLLAALDVARELGARDIVLLGDARMIVAQATGKGKAGRFAPYLAQFQAKAAGFERVRVRYVRRHHNLAGIGMTKYLMLAKQARQR